MTHLSNHLVFYNRTMLPFPEWLVSAWYIQILKLVLCVPVEWCQKFSSHQRWEIPRNSHLWELTVILNPICCCYSRLGWTRAYRNTCWRGRNPQGACAKFLHWQNGQAGCLLNIFEMSGFFSMTDFYLWWQRWVLLVHFAAELLVLFMLKLYMNSGTEGL